MAPHLYAGPIEWAANIQLGACIPNGLVFETIETNFHNALIDNAIEIEDGHIIVPTGPGLGIELNEELARANPYDGDELHLQMQDAPHTYGKEHWFEGG